MRASEQQPDNLGFVVPISNQAGAGAHRMVSQVIKQVSVRRCEEQSQRRPNADREAAQKPQQMSSPAAVPAPDPPQEHGSDTDDVRTSINAQAEEEARHRWQPSRRRRWEPGENDVGQEQTKRRQGESLHNGKPRENQTAGGEQNCGRKPSRPLINIFPRFNNSM